MIYAISVSHLPDFFRFFELLLHLAQSYSQAVHPSPSWQPLPAFVSFELRLQNVSLLLPSGLHENINRCKVKETALKV